MRVRSVWDAARVDLGEGRRFLRDMGQRDSGPREVAKQALKAGLAAVAAWVLAAHVLRLPMPYVAPWAAMIMVRSTVYWSAVSAVRQVASVTLGVVLAYLAGVALPTAELTLAVLVPIVILVSRWDRLGDQGMYVPFTALFMVVIGGTDGGYLLLRLTETALGVLIGTAVNLLVFPPVRVRGVGDAGRRVADEVQRLLRDMAAGVRRERGEEDSRGWVDRADLLDDHVWEVRRSLRHGRESLLLNPREPRGRYGDDVARYRAAIDLVGRTTDAVQSVANTLRQADREDTAAGALDAEFAARYADVLEAAAGALDRRIAALVLKGPGGAAADPGAAVSFGVLDALERDIDPRSAGSADGGKLKGALLLAARELFQELSA